MIAPQLSIDNINEVISNTEYTLSSLPRSDPRSPPLLTLLGVARLFRYKVSDDGRDLDTSITQLVHAIFLPFGLSISDLNLINAFFHLSVALFHRSHKLKHLGSVKHCVRYLHFLQDQSLEAFGIESNNVTTLLVRALALQMELEPGHEMRHLEEMSALCSKLLSSNIDQSLLDTAIVTLASAVSHFLTLSNEPSQQIIECLREATRRLPHLHFLPTLLSMSLSGRFYTTRSQDDYEDAMAALDETIASSSTADIPREYVGHAFGQAVMLTFSQSGLDGNPKYVEEAIFRFRAYLSKIPSDDPKRPRIAQAIETLENIRFQEFGIAHDRQETRSDDPDAVKISHLAASLSKSNAGKNPSMILEDRLRHLNALLSLSMGRITNITDVEEAIKYYQLLLASLQTSRDDQLTSMVALKLANSFLRAFKHTQSAHYLNESIAVFRGILKMPYAHWFHFDAVVGLISSLSERLALSEDRRDLEEVMKFYPIAVTDTNARVTLRFRASWRWALMARAYKDPSTPTAYEIAASLMQVSLTFAPTLEIQHSCLVSMRDYCQKLPLDHASYQIEIGQVENAIETLERGRGLLWSEMRGFRTSIDRLHVVDSSLVKKFADVNRDLEELTNSPDAQMNDDKAEGLDGMDPFSRLVVKQRELLEVRNSIIKQIQALPGWGQFLMSPSFETLRSAATHGPVIIINHSEWRSNIIILLHDALPSLMHMTTDFYSRANRMRDKLFGARRKGLDSREYEDALSSVLAELYDLIGRQVIERLDLLNVPEQSRVWWCPTSAFCSLPLHAMGPIRTSGPHKLYFSDLYIPSYTPTLSALIEARKPGTKPLHVPPLLLVTQPDVKMPNALQEMRVVQAIATSVTTLTRETATPPATLEHLRNHRFLHISCHGELKTGKPFDASFKLNQGTRLTLLDIVRSQLPTAEFAFLSACHTAEITEESIADEGLHLTAAVQYCGFRSVVGTMWAMADIDGPDLAGQFYRSVFSDRWGGIPHCERTAEALRNAVRRLRKQKNMTLERWVNFVHYGA